MVEGSCLCGGVKFVVDGRLTPLQYCHCRRCRKASGSAFVAAVAARTENFRWLSGADLVTVYVAPIRETPPPYSSAFCRRCGSNLPLFDAERPFIGIPAGVLDTHPEIRPLRHIFVGIKAPWYAIHDGLPQFEAHAPVDQQLPSKKPK
ncbi:MAG: GFA family protein [Deltaproteobacteria bacterium]|nr:GFA family protein [Deltaproteobacteria bacterium]MBI3390897.1 GFA family protein [Deltaproteobacteria bacterium]